MFSRAKLIILNFEIEVPFSKASDTCHFICKNGGHLDFRKIRATGNFQYSLNMFSRAKSIILNCEIEVFLQ